MNVRRVTPGACRSLPFAVVKKTVAPSISRTTWGMTESLRTVTRRQKVTGYLAVQAGREAADVKTRPILHLTHRSARTPKEALRFRRRLPGTARATPPPPRAALDLARANKTPQFGPWSGAWVG